MALPFVSTWTGTNGDTWGSVGWDFTGNSPPNLEVNGNRGRMLPAAGAFAQVDCYAPGGNADTKTVLGCEVTFDIFPNTANLAEATYLKMMGFGGGLNYEGDYPSFSLQLDTKAAEWGSGNGASTWSYVAGDTVHVRLQCFYEGTNFRSRARYWLNSDSEGATWTNDYTNTTPDAPQSGLRQFYVSYVRASSTSGPYLDIDNLTFDTLGPSRISHTTPAVGYDSPTSPKTTPTFDVVNGDLLVVTASCDDGSGSAQLGTPSASGGSVTWTLQQNVLVGTYSETAVWTGAVGATATGITVSLTSAAYNYNFDLTVWRDHGGVGNSAKDNLNLGVGLYPSLAITCSANSALVTAIGDWDASDGATRTWATVTGRAITEDNYQFVAGKHTIYAGYAPDTGAAGSKTVGLVAPSPDRQKASIVAVEILAPSSGTPLALPLRRRRQPFQQGLITHSRRN